MASIWIISHDEGLGDEIDGHFSSKEKAEEALVLLGDKWGFQIEEVELDPIVKHVPRMTYAKRISCDEVHPSADVYHPEGHPPPGQPSDPIQTIDGYKIFPMPDGSYSCSWGGQWLSVYGKTPQEALNLGRAEVAKG